MGGTLTCMINYKGIQNYHCETSLEKTTLETRRRMVDNIKIILRDNT